MSTGIPGDGPGAARGPRGLPCLDVLHVARPVAVGAPAAGDVLGPSSEEEQLCALYAHEVPAGSRWWVRANMVASIDGAAWGASGVSSSINGPADHRAFRVMRALADVVLVGAGTVRAEGYTPLDIPRGLEAARTAAGRPAVLHTAVVTRSGVLPASMTAPSGREAPFVLTTERGAAAVGSSVPGERVVVCGEDDVDVRLGLATLAGHGLSRVLCEGGPALLGTMLEEDAVDELCLTTSPLLVGGDASRPVRTGAHLAARAPARLEHLLHSHGVLLARWSVRQTLPAPVV